MKCRECGFSLADHVIYCPACGAQQQSDANPARTISVSAQKPSVANPALAGALAKAGKSPLPRPGDTFAARYRIEKYLGLGSLCNAYLCRDTAQGNRELVLKIMHARKASEPGMTDSFLFLAESVSKYDHRGIAKIFESGIHEGIPFYTMEWVTGTPLRMWLMERLNFENRVLPGLGIIRSLLDVFEVIHDRGCYGCLKPENVFITLNGPVVMDFAVVGFLSPQEFEFNSYARRYLPYMAPELRQDWGNLVPHSDYFSIGALLYEILVGRVPATPLRLPSELSRAFGIESDEIILKSMASRPMDRFGTLEGFKVAVESLQSTLLNAFPREAGGEPAQQEALPFDGRISDVDGPSSAVPHLDVTSDMQAVHNPNLAFSTAESEEFEAIRDPGSDTLAANPWMREKSDVPATDARRTQSPSVADGAPSVLDGAASIEKAEAEADSFSESPNRHSEQAHAQRRFAHDSVSPLPYGDALPPEGGVVAGHLIHNWDGLVENKTAPVLSDDISVEEEDAKPVPPWLWVLIALAGSLMVVGSAYFGLMLPK